MKHQPIVRRHWTRFFCFNDSAPGRRAWVFAALAVALVFAGCASSEVAHNAPMAVDERAPRPSRILVYDFAATAAEIPSDAPVGARMSPGVSLSPEQIAIDRQLGVDMGAQLVAAIRGMGLSAERASAAVTPQPNDIVIRGCFVSMQESNASQRYTIGLDFGASELMTAVEGFQITPQGLARRPAIGPTTATDGNPPGVLFTRGMKIQDQATFRAKVQDWAKQTVQEIADRIRARFREQGWI